MCTILSLYVYSVLEQGEFAELIPQELAGLLCIGATYMGSSGTRGGCPWPGEVPDTNFSIWAASRQFVGGCESIEGQSFHLQEQKSPIM